MENEREREEQRRAQELAAFEKKLTEQVRARVLARQQDIRMGVLSKPEPARDKNNPLDEPARHKEAQARGQEQRLAAIKSAAHREAVRESVEQYYGAWTQALKKAYAVRYDLSQRLYERRLAQMRIDERLIPNTEKETMRQEAIREAVFNSQTRIEEINRELPRIIDRAIDNAALFDRNRAKGSKDKDRGDFER